MPYASTVQPLRWLASSRSGTWCVVLTSMGPLPCARASHLRIVPASMNLPASRIASALMTLGMLWAEPQYVLRNREIDQ